MTDDDVRYLTWLQTTLHKDRERVRRKEESLKKLMASCDHKHPDGESAAYRISNSEQSYTECWICKRTISSDS